MRFPADNFVRLHISGLGPAHAGGAREKCYTPEPFAFHFTVNCDLDTA